MEMRNRSAAGSAALLPMVVAFTDERELIQKIIQEDCVEADLAQALGIVRNRQFYFLLPFLLRPPCIDQATENRLEKLFIGLLLEQFQDHPIGEWCAALQKEILQTTA